MKAKDVIEGIEEGFDDNEKIADAVEWVEDAANRLADFEQDNHMQAIKIEKMQAEIDALKAQNAELLAALTESLAYVEATLSNHDAGCQRHPSTEHARDCILSDLDQIKTAIAKARGDL